MQSESIIAAQMPPAAPVTVQRGLATSSGQFTAIFTLVSLLLSFVGFHYTPAQIDNWAQTVESILTTLGPIFATIPILMSYFTQRGKITSNAIKAQATILSNPTLGEPIAGTLQTASFAGGLDFKDPTTYQQLLHIAGELGVPGAHQADAISQQIPVGQLLTGILGMFHKKTKSLPDHFSH